MHLLFNVSGRVPFVPSSCYNILFSLCRKQPHHHPRVLGIAAACFRPNNNNNDIPLLASGQALSDVRDAPPQLRLTAYLPAYLPARLTKTACLSVALPCPSPVICGLRKFVHVSCISGRRPRSFLCFSCAVSRPHCHVLSLCGKRVGLAGGNRHIS